MRVRHPRVRRAGAFLVVLGLLSAMTTGFAPGARAEPIPPGNLGGFEIDGNQDEGVDAGGADLATFDWETVATDPRITQSALMVDDGLTWINEAKENDPTDWACVDNEKESTPKDDLLRVYLASQINADDQFLHIGYVRQEGTGNTDINVEFNQLSADFDPCVGDTDGRIRTAGDLLISFTFGGGVQNPATIEVFRWDATEISETLLDPPAPGNDSDKTPEDGHWDLISTVFGANGADNTGTIVDHFFEGDPLAPRTFGEVTLNLEALFEDLLTCPGLGFATVHSRASHDMSSDLKDVLPEVPFNLSDCGSLKLRKVNELGAAMAGVEFGLYVRNADGSKGVLGQLPGSSPDVPGTDLICETDSEGICTFDRVPPGDYLLDEINLPASHSPDLRLPYRATIEAFEHIDLTDDLEKKCVPLVAGCEWFVNSRIPNVSVVKTTSTGTVNSGDQVKFQIVVTNAGPGIAKDVTFTDNLPDGVTWSFDPTSATVDGCAFNTDNNLVCTFLTMAAGAVTINLVGTTDRADCPGIENAEFRVSASNETTEAARNNLAPAVPIIVNCPVVTVEKRGNVDPISAGDQAIYTIRVTNNGPGTATNVLVSDALPAGVEWTAGAPFPSPACTINATDKRTLSCTFASMAPNTTQVIQVVGTTDAADCAGLNNELVSVRANGAGDDDEDIPIVVNCPDMTVSKIGNLDPINAGDPNTKARYTITVDNIGDGTAKNVTFTDVLPAGLNWTAGTGFPSAACVIATDTRQLTGDHQTLTCSWATFPADPVTIVVEALTDPADCPSIMNPISSVFTPNEANTTNNSTAASTIIINCPDLELLKDADAESVSRGDPIGFKIKVWNRGDGVAYGATVSDPLPAGFDWEYVAAGSVLPAGASCSVSDANPNVLSCALGDLPAKGSAASPAAVIHVVASGTRDRKSVV